MCLELNCTELLAEKADSPEDEDSLEIADETQNQVMAMAGKCRHSACKCAPIGSKEEQMGSSLTYLTDFFRVDFETP